MPPLYDSGGGGGGGGPVITTLGDLADVNIENAIPGQVLVLGEEGTTWLPGLTVEGEPEVGAWENDLETNFIYPAPVETNLQAAPLVIPTSRNSVPTIEITVTEDMLIQNTGADIGHRTAIVLMANFRTLSGSGNPTIESAHWVEATGVEFTNSNLFGGPGAGQRTTVATISPAVAVGDKVRMRIWSPNGANHRIDWWARRSLVTRIGAKADAGRVGLLRDITRIGAVSGFVPTTVLNDAPAIWANGGELTREQWIDKNVAIGQNNVPGSRACLADAKMGAMVLSEGVAGNSYTYAGNSSSNALVPTINAPAQYRVDRLWIPPAP